MKTRAAVLRKAGAPWEVAEPEPDLSKANEVLVRVEAAGRFRSCGHVRARGRARLPAPGGSYRLPQKNAEIFVWRR